MLLKPASLIAGDTGCVAVSLTFLPLLPASEPLYDFIPTEVPTSYFCAARLPLPYLIPVIKKVVLTSVDLTVRQILGLPGVTVAPEVQLRATTKHIEIIGTSDNPNTTTDKRTWNVPSNPDFYDSINNTLDTVRVNDRIDFSLHPSEDQVGGERVLTVDRIFSNQNGKLVLLGQISTPEQHHPYTTATSKTHNKTPSTPTLIVAKLRTSTDEAESFREHTNELEMLRLVTKSPTHGMFPRLVGCGEVRIQVSSDKIIMVPLLLMSHLPYPTITDLLRESRFLPDNAYSTGDKRVFHNDLVLREGLDCAVAALRLLGLRHGDLKSGNVVYRVGTGFLGGLGSVGEGMVGAKRGKVWLIDLESVGAVIPEYTGQHEVSAKEEKIRDRKVVKDIISDFWRYELCCAQG